VRMRNQRGALQTAVPFNLSSEVASGRGMSHSVRPAQSGGFSDEVRWPRAWASHSRAGGPGNARDADGTTRD
jgi:hypothetical protein